mgnify:CR=1 FL=1
MIKFFRKIRYNLMGQNKTGKYLKYAIGEIVLVVIGILIALQINNWNQNRIEANEELNILKALKVGLETDLNDLNYNAISIENSINSANTVIQSLENDEPYRDSVADHLGFMMLPVKFLYSTSAFETLKSKASIQIKKHGDNLQIAITAQGEKLIENPSLEEKFLEKDFPIDLENLKPEEKLAFENLNKRKDIININNCLKQFFFNINSS